MNMHNPPHPGQVLKELYIKPLKLSVTATAEAMGVSRKTLSEIVNRRTSITAETAIRIAKAFGTTPQSWLSGLAKYDVWQLERKHKGISGVKRLYTPDSDLRP